MWVCMYSPSVIKATMGLAATSLPLKRKLTQLQHTSDSDHCPAKSNNVGLYLSQSSRKS